MGTSSTMARYGMAAMVGAVVIAGVAAERNSAQAQDDPELLWRRGRTGNVIFIHPDGTGANHWGAGRIYWQGPDGMSEWDRLPETAVYRGHMADQLVGTSNGGATTHAFGYKVEGPGSYGKDGDREAARSIVSLSGFPGSILREAATRGHPIGVVNDGDAAEPGTGAFLAEVGNRDDAVEIVRQIIEGRPGFAGEPDPAVVLGGGERFFLPAGTPRCTRQITATCAVHVDPVTGDGPSRTDGRNLIQAAEADGWVVIRTRQQFDTLRARVIANSSYAPKVLGLFAADDIFNDVPEEQLIAAGLVDSNIPANDKRGNIILWGDKPGTLGYNPPRADEMTDVAITILERRSAQMRRPFMLVSEVESTDNFGNSNNAIGSLSAVDDANGVIGAARAFQARSPRTLVLTAADSDGGALQVVGPPPVDAAGNVTTVNFNPTGDTAQQINAPVDGLRGRNSQPFRAARDAYGQELPFAVSWSGTPDVSGAIVSRAQGFNAQLLSTRFAERYDNTDVYRHMYITLFGKLLPSSIGQRAPDRR